MSEPIVISADLLKMDGTIPVIGANFEEFEAKLSNALAQYEMSVTEENLSDAKKMATELNKIAKAIREASTKHLRPYKEPINNFEEKVRKLIESVLGKRANLLADASKFEEKRKEEAEEAVICFLADLYENNSLAVEYQNIDTSPFAVVGTLTNGGKLTAKVREQLTLMVSERVSHQHKVELRVASLAGASIEVGLKTALVRQDVEPFLNLDDEIYQARLTQKLNFELDKQQKVEARIRAEAEAEAQRKAQAEIDSKVEEKVQAQVAVIQKESNARIEQIESRAVSQARSSIAPPSHSTPETKVSHLSQPRAINKKALANGQMVHTVTVVFEVTTSVSVPSNAVEKKVREKFQSAGFVEPKSIVVS